MKFGVRLLALLVLVFAALSVSAHEGREVGEYSLVFGWRSEPALVGYPNGPEVILSPHHSDEAAADDATAEAADDHHDEDTFLEGVEVALQVEVTFGPSTITLPLEAAWGETGHYIADLIPTRPGDYTFRVFGTIGDLAVDEIFTSAAGEFSSVEPVSDVTFPDSLPSTVELLERIAALEARLALLEGG